MVVEPLSTLMLINASLGIARSLVHTIQELYELAEQYETAALGIRTVATQCNTFRIAIQRINDWLTKQDETTRQNLDEDFWQALADNLDTGKLVIEDLEKRIKGLKKDAAKFWTRTKYLWNSTVIAELQSQIQGLMSALGILIQVIEMPTPGGKRSQSLAQRNRLNNITKSVRQTVEQRMERVQRSQEQNFLDDVDSEPTPDALQQPLPFSRIAQTQQRTSSQSSVPTRDSSTNDQVQGYDQLSKITSAPPPYEYYLGDRIQPRTESTPVTDNTKKVADVAEEKTGRSKWTLGFKKRSSTPKVEQVSRNSSSLTDTGPKDTTPNSQAPSSILNPFDDANSQIQETPAMIDTSMEKDEYFGLQMAMMGMSMPTPIQASSGGLKDENIDVRPWVVAPPVEADAGRPAMPSQTKSMDAFQRTGTTSSYGGLDSDNLGTIASNSAATSTTSYYPPPLEPSQTTQRSPPISPPAKAYTSSSTTSQTSAFERIRPSQRVRETRDRSRSQDPPRNATTSTSSEARTNFSISNKPRASSTEVTNQIWRTSTSSPTSTLSTSSQLRLKIIYDPTLYTSRISTAAARSLHLLDHALANTIDNIPIATLTLLYTVSDGENQSVMGDEVELEVMHEEDCRGMEITFGAGQVHIGQVIEGSKEGVLWWSERGVPRTLRTLDGLRRFNRFELSRW